MHSQEGEGIKFKIDVTMLVNPHFKTVIFFFFSEKCHKPFLDWTRGYRS